MMEIRDTAFHVLTSVDHVNLLPSLGSPSKRKERGYLLVRVAGLLSFIGDTN